MKKSFVLSELLIALAIFCAGLALGIIFVNQKSTSSSPSSLRHSEGDSPNRTNSSQSSDHESAESAVGVLDMKGIPSSAQIVKHIIDQGKKRKRAPQPWDSSVRSILNNSITTPQKVQSLFYLAESLPPEGKHYCYATIALRADGQTYQQLVLPKIWAVQTPPDLAYTLTSGLISQPDQVKLPAAVELMQHPNDDVANLAYSLLWSYFPDEPDTNYANAVQRFLANPRGAR